MTEDDAQPTWSRGSVVDDPVAARLGSLLRLPSGEAPGVVALGTRDAHTGVPDPGRAAALIHLAGDSVLVGPWGETEGAHGACGQCLAIRWQRLRTRSEREALEHGRVPTAVGTWPLLTPFVVDAVGAALVSVARAAPDPPRRSGPRLRQVTRIDLASLAVGTFPVLREPLCPSCGPPACRDPLVAGGLRPRPASRPGTCRGRRVEDLALPAAALANPVAGVLGTRTWRDLLSPTTAPVAGSALVRGYAGLVDVTWSGQAASYATSRALAFVEGLERYAGTHRRHAREVVVAAYDDVADRAVHPLSCGDYEPQSYAADPLLDRFDPTRPLPWVWGRCLTEDRAVLVPSRLVYYSAGVAADSFVFECSNGCATGSSREEAALFGLLELVERDAFLIGWYAGLDLPQLTLDDVASDEVAALRSRAAYLGYELRAYDNRIDIDVPVVTALAVREDGAPGAMSFAAGARLDPTEAVAAALSETLTYLPHLRRQAEAAEPELRAMAADHRLVRHLTDHARLFGLPEMRRHAWRYLRPRRTVRFADAYAGRDDSGGTDLAAALTRVVGEVTSAGHHVVVVDQTTPEQETLGLHTVAVLAPGLVPIDFGWSRQRALRMPRLRTAPRRAGMRDRDVGDDELVRVPHPFP